MVKSRTIEEVRKAFQDEGYELLAHVYINGITKMNYKCSNGHVNETDWNHFQQGHRCPDCQAKYHTTEDARVFFQQRGYEMLSPFAGVHGKITYKCPVGHINQITFRSFQSGKRCPECYGNKKLTIDQVHLFFEHEGYILLSTQYHNNRTKLDYQCPAGHMGKMTWNNFKQSHQRCPECGGAKREKRLGEILEDIFPGQVKHWDNLDFLGLQKVDFSVRSLKIAFEHDGEQHFQPTRFKGVSAKAAVKNFQSQQQRDVRKNQLCKENNYKMIRIAYYEDLTPENVQKKIDAALQVEVSNDQG